MNKRQKKKRNKQLALAAAILGAAGGAVKSARKAAAARANGKKGGRPRKDASNEDLPSASAVTALYKRLEALTDGVIEYSEADDEFVLVDPKRPRKEAGNE